MNLAKEKFGSALHIFIYAFTTYREFYFIKFVPKIDVITLFLLGNKLSLKKFTLAYNF